MASTRHHKNSARSHRKTGNHTRSSSDLRIVARLQAQTLRKHRLPPRKGASIAARKTLCSRNRISGGPKDHHLPQRSSLRRAIRESLGLSKQAMQLTVPSPIDPREPAASSNVSLGSPGPPKAKLQASAHQYKYRIKGVSRRVEADTTITTTTTTTRSSKIARGSALELKPQRNSLRRAIRDSLEGMNMHYEDPVSQTSYPRIIVAQSPMPGLASTKKPKAAADQAADKKNAREHARLSSNLKEKAMSHTLPQRSSLRRAVRESLGMVGCEASVSTVLDEINSDLDTTRKHITEDPPQSPDSDSSAAISSPDSSPVLSSDILITPPDTPTDISSDAITPSQFNCTPSISSLPNLRSRKKSAQESSPFITRRVPLSASSVPKSPLCSVSAPESDSKLVSPISVFRQQIPTLVSPATSSPGDGQSQSTLDDSQAINLRRGWHQVRGIINEAPVACVLGPGQGRVGERNPRLENKK
ncbi:hypothetical protein O1611_g6631 [Lasiodiplodia mahajangana]|uniref:Uncharacterized protein n=1 Tax=Lasiodiplodia mahajangana TaxID=1108764 RepID=A0ACC2JHR2_9PEZI|nr:hypothetical protein O1611_g6631 [Lasiodiplodia mahajangana]